MDPASRLIMVHTAVRKRPDAPGEGRRTSFGAAPVTLGSPSRFAGNLEVSLRGRYSREEKLKLRLAIFHITRSILEKLRSPRLLLRLRE